MKKEDKVEEPETKEKQVKEATEKAVEAAEEQKAEESIGKPLEEKEVVEETTEVKEKTEEPSAKEEKPRKKEKEEEEEIVEERTYTIPLSRAWIMPANKRAPRAIRILRSFITKHMKLEAHKETEGEEEEKPSKLVINNEVNLRIWCRGIEKPPRKIRVRATKDKEGNVTVYLAEGD